MFVQNLNAKQQSVLLYLAKEVINADNNLHESEQDILSIIMSQVESSELLEVIRPEEIASLFDTNMSKASLLLELIGVAYADGDYHNEERALIKKYADTIGISEQQLRNLEDWVSKQLQLTLEVQKLLS